MRKSVLIGSLSLAVLFAGNVMAEKAVESPEFDKPGFVTMMEDGRLWIFKEGSEEFNKFKKDGELAKHAVRPGGGPNGITVKAPDTSILDEYMGVTTEKASKSS